MAATMVKEWIGEVESIKAVSQIITLGMIITTSLMIWKGLILFTGSKCPVVVVLSGLRQYGTWFQKGFAMDACGEDIKTDNAEASSTLKKEDDISLIEIKVLFFARARDLTGVTEMPLKVSPGSSTLDCLNSLVAKFPSLEEIRSCMVVALNEVYTSESVVVKNRDELAIIPPISGG